MSVLLWAAVLLAGTSINGSTGESPSVTLICTGPAPASGSHPEITCYWQRNGHNCTNATENVVKLCLSSDLSSFLQWHGANLTCRAAGNVTTKEAVTSPATGPQSSKTNETPSLNNTEKTGHHNCNTTSSNNAQELSCVCEGESSHVPTISSKVLDNQIHYSIVSASNCTVTIRTSNTSNKEGNANWVQNPMLKLQQTVKQPEVICAFFVGVVLATLASTVVCCSMRRSHRKKLRMCRGLSAALEMMNSQEVDATNDPEAAGGAVAAGHSDVDYSTIKFFAVKRVKNQEESRQTTETEYAEIKREEMVQEQDGEGSQEELVLPGEGDLAGNGEQEDAALYPDVEDVVGEMEACSV